MNKALSILVFLTFAAGCGQAPDADPSEITARSDAWEAALNAKDIDTLVGFYTDDARVLAPNAEMTQGSGAVRSAFGAMIDAGLGGELTSIDVQVSGDIGYNVGTYSLTAGGGVVDTGKFIETWRRGGDGQWRISNDIWNSDMPAMGHDEHESADSTHILITHEVDDAEAWLAAWRGENSRHDLFKTHGAAHVHTFVSADNPNLTGLVVNVADLDALMAMIASDEGQAAAAEDGVRMDTLLMLTEAE